MDNDVKFQEVQYFELSSMNSNIYNCTSFEYCGLDRLLVASRNQLLSLGSEWGNFSLQEVPLDGIPEDAEIISLAGFMMNEPDKRSYDFYQSRNTGDDSVVKKPMIAVAFHRPPSVNANAPGMMEAGPISGHLSPPVTPTSSVSSNAAPFAFSSASTSSVKMYGSNRGGRKSDGFSSWTGPPPSTTTTATNQSTSTSSSVGGGGTVPVGSSGGASGGGGGGNPGAGSGEKPKAVNCRLNIYSTSNIGRNQSLDVSDLGILTQSVAQSLEIDFMPLKIRDALIPKPFRETDDHILMISGNDNQIHFFRQYNSATTRNQNQQSDFDHTVFSAYSHIRNHTFDDDDDDDENANQDGDDDDDDYNSMEDEQFYESRPNASTRSQAEQSSSFNGEDRDADDDDDLESDLMTNEGETSRGRLDSRASSQISSSQNMTSGSSGNSSPASSSTPGSSASSVDDEEGNAIDDGYDSAKNMRSLLTRPSTISRHRTNESGTLTPPENATSTFLEPVKRANLLGFDHLDSPLLSLAVQRLDRSKQSTQLYVGGGENGELTVVTKHLDRQGFNDTVSHRKFNGPLSCVGLVESGRGVDCMDIIVGGSLGFAAVVPTTMEKGYHRKLEESFILPDSTLHDSVLCCKAADINWDGQEEILVGTYGQQLLTYSKLREGQALEEQVSKDATKRASEYRKSWERPFAYPIFSIENGDFNQDGAEEIVINSLRGVHILQPDLKKAANAILLAVEQAEKLQNIQI